MLKKITLIIAVTALLVGAEIAAAQQDEGSNPQPEPKHTQRGPKRHKGQEFGPQMFDRWLDALAKAYQENDMEKMGELIKKMQRARQEMQKARAADGPRHRGFREGYQGRGQQGQFHKKSNWYAPQAGMRGFCPGLQYRESGGDSRCTQRPSADRWEQGFGRCGFGRRGHCMWHQGRGRWNMDTEPRGLGRRHQGRPHRHRDMNDPTPSVPQCEDVNELTQDTPQEDFSWD